MSRLPVLWALGALALNVLPGCKNDDLPDFAIGAPPYDEDLGDAGTPTGTVGPGRLDGGAALDASAPEATGAGDAGDAG